MLGKFRFSPFVSINWKKITYSHLISSHSSIESCLQSHWLPNPNPVTSSHRGPCQRCPNHVARVGVLGSQLVCSGRVDPPGLNMARRGRNLHSNHLVTTTCSRISTSRRTHAASEICRVGSKNTCFSIIWSFLRFRIFLILKFSVFDWKKHSPKDAILHNQFFFNIKQFFTNSGYGFYLNF